MTSYARAPGVLWRRAGDGVALLPPGEEIVGLRGTGATLWELLARAGSDDELVAALASLYGADVDAVAADLAPVLDDLVRRGVVRTITPTA